MAVVLALRPTSDISAGLTVVGTTYHYDAVNESSSDGGSTYVWKANGGGAEDVLGIADYGSESGTISNVRILARAWMGETGTAVSTIGLKYYGYTGSTNNLTTSEATYYYDYALNPVDSATWEWSDIDSIQVGLYLNGEYVDKSNYSDAYCTQLWIEVTYTPTTLYWYGNGGSWSDYTNHWSAYSGNSPAGPSDAVPTSSQHAIFDSNSFGSTSQTVTVGANAYCNNLTWTGVANSPTLSITASYALYFYGDVTLVSGMTISNTNGSLIADGSSTSKKLTTNGKSIGCYLIGSVGTLTLQDTLTCNNGFITYTGGTIDTNDKTVTCYAVGMYGGTIDFGSSTFNSSSNFDASGATSVVCGTSTINVGGTFSGGGKTYYIVNLTGATSTISGSNTFTTLALPSGTTQTISFTDGTTQTVSNATLSGDATHQHTLQGTSTAGWQITKSGTACVVANYCTINYSHGHDNNMWYYGTGSSANSYSTSNGWQAVPTDRYWNKNSGTWSDTTKWAYDSGGGTGAVVPTSSDNVYFDANSFNTGSQSVIINELAICNAMNWTGATNTPTFACGSTYSVWIYGNLTLISGMAVTGTYPWYLRGTSGTQSINIPISIDAVSLVAYATGSCTVTLASNITSSNVVVHSQGAFNTAGYTINCATFTDWASGTARTLTLGASTINCTGWTQDSANFTLNANTSTIKVTGTGDFKGGSKTYNAVELNGSSHTITGTNTFASLSLIYPSGTQTVTFPASVTTTITGTLTTTGYSSSNRCNLQSSSGGTRATISAATIAITKTDLTDITGAGAANWTYGAATDVRQTSNCSGMIFRAYWKGGTGSWSDVNEWSTTSGGIGGPAYLDIVPDAITDVYFDANSFSAGSQTVTVDVTSYCRNIDFTGITNTPTFRVGYQVPYIGLWVYGNVILASGMIFSSSNAEVDLIGSSKTITCNGLTTGGTLVITNGGSYTFTDAYTLNNFFIVASGTCSTGNYNFTGTLYSSYGVGCTINLGSSTLNCWDLTFDSSVTLNAGTSTINISNAFTTAGQTFNIVNLNASSHTITGSNTFNTLALSSGTTQTITFTDGTNQTVTTPTLSGDATHTHTLQGSSTGGWQITKAGGGTVVVSYAAINYSHGHPDATWKYASTSTANSYSTSNGWAADMMAYMVSALAKLGTTAFPTRKGNPKRQALVKAGNTVFALRKGNPTRSARAKVGDTVFASRKVALIRKGLIKVGTTVFASRLATGIRKGLIKTGNTVLAIRKIIATRSGFVKAGNTVFAIMKIGYKKLSLIKVGNTTFANRNLTSTRRGFIKVGNITFASGKMGFIKLALVKIGDKAFAIVRMGYKRTALAKVGDTTFAMIKSTLSRQSPVKVGYKVFANRLTASKRSGLAKVGNTTFASRLIRNIRQALAKVGDTIFAIRKIAGIRSGLVKTGIIVFALLKTGYAHSALVKLGNTVFANRLTTENRNGLIKIGVKPLAIRKATGTRSGLIKVGDKVLSTRKIDAVRSALIKVGNTVLASRLISGIRSALVKIGEKVFAIGNQAIHDFAYTALIKIGEKVFSIRKAAGSRNSLIKNGIKALPIRVVSSKRSAFVKEGVKALGTRVMIAYRLAFVKIGVKPFATRIHMFYAKSIPKLGVTVFASRAAISKRASLVKNGIKTIASKAITSKRSSLIKDGIKVFGIRRIVSTRSAFVKVGVKGLASIIKLFTYEALCKIGMKSFANRVIGNYRPGLIKVGIKPTGNRNADSTRSVAKWTSN